MSKRKIWTHQQDSVLRILRQQRGLKKWSEIAKRMEEQFGITQRTGKQCRQRYHNHLDSAIVLSQWSPSQELILYNMHTELGNKWSQISQKIPGRSDNCIKNHFYSKLRKAVRKINRIVQESNCKRWREVKLPLLNKIIETTEERFKNSSKFEEEVVEKCIETVNRLYCFDNVQAQDEEKDKQETQVKALIDDAMWLEGKLRKFSKGQKEKETETTHESREADKNSKTSTASEGKEEPFYQIFKRVCDQIMHNNN